ncbi:ABC transporter permease [Snuella lapsa]|uniref:ABC transporter permease n=2 Tax=Snuella lapsa TaxID=870481 RepID=A0ABP6WR32_9FLAO
MLFSYVYNELTMDNFHEQEKDVFMVIMKESPKGEWRSPYKFDPELYPEIESSVSLKCFRENDTKIKYNENIYTPIGMVVDSTFFQVFDFKLTQGNSNTVLNDKQSIIISEKFSKKLFGDENPIGKKIDFEVRMYQGVHTVQGIVKIPSNSSITFDYIIPHQRLSHGYGRSGVPFFKVKPNFNENGFKEKIEASNNKVPNVYPQLTESITSIVNLDDMYFSNELNSIKQYAPFGSGNEKNLRVLFIIILVILFVSVLNYSNLQIVNTNAVLKSIAISKVNGALKKHIVFQKLVETLILILFSGALITIGYKLILPQFNTFAGVTLAPPVVQVFLLNTVILLTITIFGALYPVWVINRFSTIKNIKQNVKISHTLSGRHVTIIMQYSLAFILLISGLVINNQLGLMLNKDLGFNKEGIMKVKLFYEPPFNMESRNWSQERRREEHEKLMQVPRYINDQLASFSCIEKMAQGKSPLNSYSSNWKIEGGDYESVNTLIVTPENKDIFDFKVIKGRFFEREVDRQKGGLKIVVNEAALKYWNITDFHETLIKNDHIGKSHVISENGTKVTHNDLQIIGVIKDFNYEHLSVKPKPLVMVYYEYIDDEYFIKFHKGQTQVGIQLIEALFKEVNPNQTFRYSFLSDEIAALYQKEKRLSTIYIVFTVIALLISAIGLFTIALYDTQRRVKEVGVRKVNGATIKEIMFMLNKDFIKWVGIAFVIACPIAYYAMHKWLENFAYKTTLSWWVFALAGLFTLIIALLTVSWQTYKAATQNPVESLRDE